MNNVSKRMALCASALFVASCDTAMIGDNSLERNPAVTRAYVGCLSIAYAEVLPRYREPLTSYAGARFLCQGSEADYKAMLNSIYGSIRGSDEFIKDSKFFYDEIGTTIVL